MKSSEPTPQYSPKLWAKLFSVLVLATGMLLASSMTLKASWLWVLGPVALLALLDLKSAGSALSAVTFYAGLLGVALAFHFVGLPVASTSGGCCGTSAGCGSGGCGTSSGGGCGCLKAW